MKLLLSNLIILAIIVIPALTNATASNKFVTILRNSNTQVLFKEGSKAVILDGYTNIKYENMNIATPKIELRRSDNSFMMYRPIITYGSRITCKMKSIVFDANNDRFIGYGPIEIVYDNSILLNATTIRGKLSDNEVVWASIGDCYAVYDMESNITMHSSNIYYYGAFETWSIMNASIAILQGNESIIHALKIDFQVSSMDNDVCAKCVRYLDYEKNLSVASIRAIYGDESKLWFAQGLEYQHDSNRLYLQRLSSFGNIRNHQVYKAYIEDIHQKEETALIIVINDLNIAFGNELIDYD